MIINVDRSKRRIVIQVDRFVDGKAMEESVSATIVAAREARGSAENFDCMVLLNTDGPISQGASQVLQNMLVRLKSLGLRRLAHVGFPALARMQIKRLTANDAACEFFDEESAAERWLAS